MLARVVPASDEWTTDMNASAARTATANLDIVQRDQTSPGITTETESRPHSGSRQRQRADLNRDHDRDSEQTSPGITAEAASRPHPGSDLTRDHGRDSEQTSPGITTETASRSQPGSRQRQRADLNRATEQPKCNYCYSEITTV